MTSNHFLVKQQNLKPPRALLDAEEHHHLSRVLRKVPGERVWLVDEGGNSYRAEVEEVGRHETRLVILEKKEAAGGRLHLVLGQALIKSKPMDMVIQKATELGVDVIIPVEAARSVVRLEAGETAKLGRWRKVAREAAKQSRRSGIPVILPPQPFSALLKDRDEQRKFILSENGGIILRNILAAGPARPGVPEIAAVVLLVGPEGGWTQSEEEQAIAAGFEAISLGRCVLRAETAALASLAAFSIFWGD